MMSVEGLEWHDIESSVVIKGCARGKDQSLRCMLRPARLQKQTHRSIYALVNRVQDWN